MSKWHFNMEQRNAIDLAADNAGVSGDDVAEWWSTHRSWTLETVIARFVNLRDQAERRAAHDTGYERRDWPHMIGKKGKP